MQNLQSQNPYLRREALERLIYLKDEPFKTSLAYLEADQNSMVRESATKLKPPVPKVNDKIPTYWYIIGFIIIHLLFALMAS